MRRRRFLATLGAATALPSAARATGGLDVAASPSPHTMRVLLSGDAAVTAVAIDAWRFSWNGRTYRGSFALAPLDAARTGLVNTLPLEAYLYGVVSKEVSAGWPAGAQQVQAILSRTYALRRARHDRPYDVTASESDQRYDGIEGETVEGRAAVDATAGTVLSFAGTPASVAYSACCGGHTADAADIWGGGVPYLRGVADPYCAGTPDFTWTATIPLALLRQTLAAQVGVPAEVRTVELRDVDASGRPRTIALLGDGTTFQMKTSDFRFTFGAGLVRSTLIRAALVQDQALVLSGNGRGHGVGLCQWGARTLAQRATTPADILQFYFAGTSLAQA